MRAKDFLSEFELRQIGQGQGQTDDGKTIHVTVPVTLQLGGEEGRLNTTIAEPATDELPTEPLFIPPMQQTLELQKQQGGKRSKAINQIVSSDNGAGGDPDGGVFAQFDDDDQQPEQSIYFGITPRG